MSGYTSKNEVIAVVKATIANDHNGTGMSRDPKDYNVSAIVRECFYPRGSVYGWGSTDEDFVGSLRRNLRKRVKA